MIICVSDNIWFQSGLSELVQHCASHRGAFYSLSYQKAKSALAEMTWDKSATIVVDYTSPDHSLLFSLLKIKRQSANNSILVVTKNEQLADVAENIVLDSVADCLIDTRESCEKLNDFMTKGLEGQVVSKSVTNKIWARIKKNACLTHREIDMIPFIIAGKGNKEISRQVDISEKMVSIHRRNIYNKLHVGNLTGLYHYFTGEVK
ncbi:MAG: LuxR C-terminal-related transcriptional regulator [Enterobacter asburiae]|jgi:DNA-binding NarL/FixJ family response regulator|nr:LuxR C-terminal-related transcriptional regulator [Enterobacter asburiae]